jgi:uncharacterized membrane protein YdjX (TVP38/TMEM64 family)
MAGARAGVAIGLLTLPLASCMHDAPTVEEANAAVLMLRGYGAWAWALGIALIWADLLLPVPQTTVIAALGLIYGVGAGGAMGTVGLVTGGLLGYGLMRTSARPFLLRVTGAGALARMQSFFDRSGAWAIVLTRSLPYSVPEVVVCLAGLSRMPVGRVVLALTLGSVPTGFLYAGIGAGWADRPLLALAVSWALPIVSLPVAMHLLRSRRGRLA